MRRGKKPTRKQKTAYEMESRDWSSDVCSSDLGLESEEDITDEPPTYTAAVETNESYTEEAVEPPP